MSGPTYQYILTTDKDAIVQFDWKMFLREESILTCKGEERELPRHFIGKRAQDVLPDKCYFMRPK